MPCVLNIVGHNPNTRLVDSGNHPLDDNRVTILTNCPKCIISSSVPITLAEGKYIVGEPVTPPAGQPAEWHVLMFNSRRVALAWIVDFAGDLFDKDRTLFDFDAIAFPAQAA